MADKYVAWSGSKYHAFDGEYKAVTDTALRTTRCGMLVNLGTDAWVKLSPPYNPKNLCKRCRKVQEREQVS